MALNPDQAVRVSHQQKCIMKSVLPVQKNKAVFGGLFYRTVTCLATKTCYMSELNVALRLKDSMFGQMVKF